MKKTILAIILGILIGGLLGCNNPATTSTTTASVPDYFELVSEHNGDVQKANGCIFIYKDTRYPNRDVYLSIYTGIGSNSVATSIVVIDNTAINAYGVPK